jgi:hypothetical protein
VVYLRVDGKWQIDVEVPMPWLDPTPLNPTTESERCQQRR